MALLGYMFALDKVYLFLEFVKVKFFVKEEVGPKVKKWEKTKKKSIYPSRASVVW